MVFHPVLTRAVCGLRDKKKVLLFFFLAVFKMVNGLLRFKADHEERGEESALM